MLGLSYLHYLLLHPHRYVSVEELVFLVSPRERDKIFEEAGEQMDTSSLQFYQLQTRQLMDHQSVNLLAQGEVQSDAIEQLLGELRRVGILGSGTVQAINNRERFRKSVGNAIRRAVSDIAHHDDALASYFQHPTLRLGYELVYVPDTPIVWKN